MPSDRDLLMGLDLSTQGLKAVVIDADLSTVYEETVNFDADLPEFGTEGGAVKHPDGFTVTSPAVMWVAAFDILLERMKKDAVDLPRIRAVSGSGQQHGSVWLKNGALDILRNLNPASNLRDQMEDAFSIKDSPIWMDASTTEECRKLEESLGGPQALADLTGSRAYERFTGNQIAKIYRRNPEAYETTERIALVSSFAASLLTGDYAPIDSSDGSGMNLMDLRARTWSQEALKVTAPDLEARLGEIVPGHTVTGTLHSYYSKRYGFAEDCAVVAFSGDNPNSLAGLRLQEPGDLALSMGTSDTMFGSTRTPKPSGDEGHVFANPVDPDGYMVMIVRQNGSLTRERIRDASASGSWDRFSKALSSTPPGNSGNIGFYLDEPEITPPTQNTGTFRYGPDGKPRDSFEDNVEVRAVVEQQMLSMRFHGGKTGLSPGALLATGGASANRAIVRVIADVFGVPVSVGECPDSASLGAAYRAFHGWKCAKYGKFIPFAAALPGITGRSEVFRPDTGAHAVYTDMLKKYGELEETLVK
ncbi:MAG: xylulokinase [Kiritimatiellia bacterium]